MCQDSEGVFFFVFQPKRTWEEAELNQQLHWFYVGVELTVSLPPHSPVMHQMEPIAQWNPPGRIGYWFWRVLVLEADRGGGSKQDGAVETLRAILHVWL